MDLLNNPSLTWKTHRDDSFGYPIHYAESVLSASADGRLQILVRWEPNCFCHFHEHCAEISSVVLEGELHVTDIDPQTGAELGRRVRAVGDFVHKAAGDMHMEQGGPSGALLLFSIYAPEGDGELARALDNDRNPVSVASLKRILEKFNPASH